MRYQEPVSPRIIGTEIEYSAMIVDGAGNGQPLSTFQTGMMYAAVPKRYRGIGEFLRNGARFYMDYNGHPEYATQESISIADVIANECAGDAIAFETSQQTTERLDGKKCIFNRRVSDYDGDSWGYHENYSFETRYDASAMHNALALHVATRNIFAGSGGLDARGNFVIAQKAGHITTDIAKTAIGYEKPLIINRDNPLADYHRWYRANVAGGDPNMSPWSTRLKLGSTVLVMDLFEDGFDFDALQPRYDNGWLARHVATDLTLRRTVELRDGRRYNALDIQREIVGAAGELGGRKNLGKEKMAIIDDWRLALSDLESDPDTLAGRADWPLRRKVIRAFADKHGLPYNDPRLRSVDLRWGSLDPRLSIGLRLRKGLWAGWMPSEELVEARKMAAPKNTRADMRHRLIEAALKRQVTMSSEASWTSFRELAPDPSLIVMNDPFKTYDPQVEAYTKAG